MLRLNVRPIITYYLRTAIVAAGFLPGIHRCPAQNLLANPGLEDINICTEYHAPCAPEAWFNVHVLRIPPLQADSVDISLVVVLNKC